MLENKWVKRIGACAPPFMHRPTTACPVLARASRFGRTTYSRTHKASAQGRNEKSGTQLCGYRSCLTGSTMPSCDGFVIEITFRLRSVKDGSRDYRSHLFCRRSKVDQRRPEGAAGESKVSGGSKKHLCHRAESDNAPACHCSRVDIVAPIMPPSAESKITTMPATC